MPSENAFRRRVVRAIRGLSRRATRIRDATGKQINFGTTAEALAWLAGVVAFALIFPPWITLVVAASALAAGAVRAAHHRVRATVVAIPLIFGSGIAGYALSTSSSHAEGSLYSAHWTPIGYGLEAALEIKNVTYLNHWGTSVEADGNDRLQLRLLIRNTNSSPSPPEIARVFAGSEGGWHEGARVISISFGLNQLGPFTEGPRVAVIAQSNGLDRFSLDGPVVFGPPSETATRVESLGGYVSPTERARLRGRLEDYTGQEYAIPSVAAHQQTLLTYPASYDTPEDALIDGHFLIAHLATGGALANPAHPWAGITEARPGETLLVAAVLDNSGFRFTSAHVRVALIREAGGRFYRAKLYIRQAGERERESSSTVVNSGNGRPITLTVEPDSTEVRPPKTKCASAPPEKAPDGIAEGGLTVSPIGGFVARDPCHGSEWNRGVLFDVAVS